VSKVYPFQIQREVRPGDFKEALWTQYMNCINSLNTLETVNQPVPTIGAMFSSRPSWEKFELNVKILRSMCDGYGLTKDDVQFEKSVNLIEKSPREQATRLFSALTELLKRKMFAERMQDLGTL
jgi:hypothetical protein